MACSTIAFWTHRLLLSIVLLGPLAQHGLGAEPFYQGKKLTFMVSHSAGGGTDIECRLYARHLNRHLGGDTTLIVQNRPGASGLLAINTLYERSRRDGTVAGCQTNSSMYQEWYLGDPAAKGLRADMSRIVPIMFAPIVSVGAVRRVLPPGIEIKVPEDIVKAQGWVAAGFRADDTKDLKFRALLDLVGARYRYVTGYPGSADLLAAFMRREVDYVDGSTPFFLNRVKPVVVDTGQATPIWYDGPVQSSQLSPAYESAEFVRRLTGKEPSGPLWKIFQIARAYRMILFPPGVPSEAIHALRSAFEALGRDHGFRAEFRKVMGVEPFFLTSPSDLEKALSPLKSATAEFKEFRERYIEAGR